jgi:hypothetical protein
MAERTCAHPGCGKPIRARGLCSTHYNQQHQPGRHAKVTVPCAVCEQPCEKGTASRYQSRFCSLFCRDVERARRSGNDRCEVPATHTSRSTPVPAAHPCRVRERYGAAHRVFFPDCSVCGRCFATPYTIKTCSAACTEIKRLDNKRAGKQRRRAVKCGAFVAPVSRRKIYERDGWRCRLCGKPVQRDAKVPHPKAPTIDHVIPLAVGGTHEPANCQTAHFLCNSLKGHRGGGEQLALLG